MTEILGMHWTLAAAIICVIMLILDLFIFNGGGLTFAADVIFALIILHFIPVENWIWLSLFGVLIYIVVLALHLFVYRQFATYVVDKFIAPQKSQNNNDILIGKIGKICWIEEHAYIRIEDEHIPCAFEMDCSRSDVEHKKAKAVSWNDSKELIVRIIE